MKEKIKQHIGEALVILGAGLFTYKLFEIISRFSVEVYTYSITENADDFLSSPSSPPSLLYEKTLIEEIHYSFSFFKADSILIWLTVGVVLLLAGILIIKNKKK